MTLMVEHGFGVSLLLFWVVREEIEKGEFNQIKITGHKLCRTVATVSLKGAESVPIRTFIVHNPGTEIETSKTGCKRKVE